MTSDAIAYEVEEEPEKRSATPSTKARRQTLYVKARRRVAAH